jgi:hypothetical protein
MTTYVIMTVGGSRGGTFTAKDDEDATRQATRRGYTVLDVIDAIEGDAVLVVVASTLVTAPAPSHVGPCPCECNYGGFCGGCGHAGCGRRGYHSR